MNNLTARKQGIDKLVTLSKGKGYITFDNIIDVSECLSLSIDEVDRISEQLLLQGVIVHDEEPPTFDGIIEDAENIYDDRSKTDYEATFREVITMNPSLEFLMDKIHQIPPPQYKEVNTLIYQAQDGNEYARTRIVSMYLRVVVRIAMNSAKRLHIDVADAISTGVIGLIRALDKFDPNGTYLFSQYAPFWVQQHINREAPTLNQDLYFPVHIKEKIFSIYDLYEEHFCSSCENHDICPNLCNEISDRLNVDVKEAQKIIGYMQANLSLDELSQNDDTLSSDGGLFESSMDENIDAQMLDVLIKHHLDSFSKREAEILIHRFGLFGNDVKTLEEVGQIFGVTRERVRQIEAKLIRKLRHPSRSRALKCYY